MKNVWYHVHRHIKKHHQKYLFGIFGGFSIVKLFLLILWIGVVSRFVFINAQLESWCTLTGQVLTWQYYTGEYYTWWSLTGQELTWWLLTWCVTISWYWTWGDLDESGALTGQTRVDESETWCFLTGQIFTEWYLTGGYLTEGYRTWWYRTWWSLTWCTQQTWDTQLQDINQHSGNGICESWDIRRTTPVSWSLFRDIFSISRIYSWTDCLFSGLSLQLRDHNNQWIALGTAASWATSFAFDSRRLYSFQLSGFYPIVWNTGAWNFYLYTWMYTGVYTRLWTWYTVRLLDDSWTPLYETPTFTIDNQYPTLTGISLQSSWSTSWYLNSSWMVTLSFIANEYLSNLNVTVWSGISWISSNLSWLLYTYTRNLSSLYPEGPLTATLYFADTAGNTWNTIFASSLIFDKTTPTVTGFMFSGYTDWLHLSYSWSEPTTYMLTYQKTWWVLFSTSGAAYLTAQQMIFSGVERDQSYMFNLTLMDRAGNSKLVTGNVLRTHGGTITSTINYMPTPSVTIVSGTLATLTSTLKVEVDKFNACRNMLTYSPVQLTINNNPFTLQMPNFQKTYVKSLVSAFTLFVMDKIKKDRTISADEMNDITKKFNNFLIILKLLRDDDNNCKQNLSNYYIIQFKNVLQQYNIQLQ